MTPEQLQEVPGIGPKMVEKIRLAVINYYAQFEEGPAAAAEFPQTEAVGEVAAAPDSGLDSTDGDDALSASEEDVKFAQEETVAATPEEEKTGEEPTE
jgi:hypothetical protein